MARLRIVTAGAALSLGSVVLGTAGCGGGGGGKEQGTPGGTTTSESVTGGTANFSLATDTDYTDPALAYYQVSWQLEYATCAKLLNYPDKPVPEGAKLVPEVAKSLPAVSSDGKTYTFTIANGFRFSPPSSQPVTSQTFKFVLERDLSPKLNSPAASFAGDIVGASAMLAGKAKHLAGVTASGDKLTIRLTKPAPDFLSRIAMPFFCAVPTGTPITPDGITTVASAGPYSIAEYTPNKLIVLKRNPNYHGSRPHNLDRIVYTVGVSPQAAVLRIQRSQTDYAADGIPPAANSQVAPKYGPGSDAAKNGKQQYFVNPTLSFRYIALNTQRPLFKNVKLRQAVNFAIDRQALLLQRGAEAGRPTDQYLPPGLEGFEDEDVYPLDKPDFDRAKQLAGSGDHGKAVLYTCNASPCPESAQIIQANLKQIGIDVDVREFERAVQLKKTGTKGEPFDMDFSGWVADYADPYDFINVLLDGSKLQAANNVNTSYFDDPKYVAEMQRAASLQGDKRTSAYAKLDVDLPKDAAPLAAWDNDNQRDFFSARMGCQLYQPIYGMDIAALCLRR